MDRIYKVTYKDPYIVTMDCIQKVYHGVVTFWPVSPGSLVMRAEHGKNQNTFLLITRAPGKLQT